MTVDPFPLIPPTPEESAYVAEGAALLTAAADRLERLVADATDTPWWFDESEDCWRLHGVAIRLPTGIAGWPDQVVNKQIAKAPKHDTPYAEYWPDAADSALLITLVNLGPELVAWLREAARWAVEVGPDRFAVAVARKVMGEER